MDRIILTTENLTTSLKRQDPAYYVIEKGVTIKTNITFPAGSVLDFRGGWIDRLTATHRYVDLNGSTVLAAGYCIFYSGIEVSGFSNSYILSEWFKTTGMAENEAINRSLIAANGIPVHLESRLYVLDGPIEFPICSTTQTLVSPGTLKISTDIAAIIVDKENITLNINRIQYIPAVLPERDDEEKTRNDIGILLTGNAYYADISVNIIVGLDKGIAVIPDVSKTGTGYSSVQYCNIRFKHILDTNYCFYVDIFTHSNGYSAPTLGTWFAETRVIGGRMEGTNGIYFVNPIGENNSTSTTSARFTESINGLLFENIGFEGITGQPLYISHVSFSQFLYLRLAESLPGLGGSWNRESKWVFLNNVSNLTFSIKGLWDPMRIDVGNNVKSVVFDAYIVDDFGEYINHFDKLTIIPLPDSTSAMVATSSIQPYNMAKTIEINEQSPQSFYTLKDLLPFNDTEYDNKTSKFNVLPRTLNVIVRANETIEIDLTGLRRFAPCVMDVYGMIDHKGCLKFSFTDYNPNINLMVLENGTEVKGRSFSFTESGLYRLTFDAKWSIVISKVTP